MTRIHKKRDGLLMIAEDGGSRFLTMFESVAYRLFGLKPVGF